MRGNAISNSFPHSTWNRGDCWVQKRCGHWRSPGNFCPRPHLFWRGGVLLEGEREELQIWWEYLLSTHCCHTGSLAAKAWVWNFHRTAFSSSKCGWHFLADLPHVNWEPLFILSSQVPQRNRLKESRGKEKRDRNRKRWEERGSGLPVCIFVFFLSCPKGHIDSCLLSTVGLGWSCQVLGIPGVHREKLGAVWLEAVPPVP